MDNLNIVWGEGRINTDAAALAERGHSLHAMVLNTYPREINALVELPSKVKLFVAWLSFDPYTVTSAQLETYGPVLLNLCRAKYGFEIGRLEYYLP